MQSWANELGQRFEEKTKAFGKPVPHIGDLQTKYLDWRAKCRELEVKLEELKKQQKAKPWWNELQIQTQEAFGLQEQHKVLLRKAAILKSAGQPKKPAEKPSSKYLDKAKN